LYFVVFCSQINRNESGETTPIRVQGSCQDDVERACDMIQNLMSNSSSDTRGSNRGRDYRRRNDRYSKDDFQSRDQGSFRQNRNFDNNDDGFSKTDYNQSYNQSNYSESSTYKNSATNNSAPEPEFQPINWNEVYAKSVSSDLLRGFLGMVTIVISKC